MGPAVLVNGRFKGGYSDALGIGYLASVLRQHGLETRIVDPNLDEISPTAAAAHVLAYCPGVIGISILSIEDRSETLEMISAIKRGNTDAHICVGGRDPSMSVGEYLATNLVDSVCVGEGELTFLRLVSAIQQATDWTNIAGLMYLKDGVAFGKSAGLRIENVDTIPFPARDALGQYLERYPGDNATQILGSRGCYAFCSFCTSPQFDRLSGGKRLRMRGVANIVAEMYELADRFGIRHFDFVDDVFMVPGQQGRHRAREFRELLNGAGQKFTFNMQCRVDAIDKVAISDLKAAGLTNIFLGIENGDDATLDIFKKGMQVEDADLALRELAEIGFDCGLEAEYRVRVGMITFHAESTLASLRTQLAAAKRWNLPPKRLNLKVTPFDGTTLQLRYRDRNMLDSSKEVPDFHFCDFRVSRHYAHWHDFVDRLSLYRDRIREIEKQWRAGPDGKDFRLVAGRARLDEIGFGIFKELIDVVEEGGGDDDCRKLVDRCEHAYLDFWQHDLLPIVHAHEAKLSLGQGKVGLRTRRVFD
jgi:hypothetical protein